MNEDSGKADDQATDGPQPDKAERPPLRKLSNDQLSQIIEDHQKWLFPNRQVHGQTSKTLIWKDTNLAVNRTGFAGGCLV